jgi:hypothetical protein
MRNGEFLKVPLNDNILLTGGFNSVVLTNSPFEYESESQPSEYAVNNKFEK